MSLTEILSRQGVTVTIRNVTLTEDDTTYGTATETYTDTLIQAIIQPLDTVLNIEKQGEVITAEAKAYVEDSVVVNEGDRLILGTETYEILEITTASGHYKKLFLTRVG